jgi:hypothetical protein
MASWIPTPSGEVRESIAIEPRLSLATEAAPT